METLQQRIRVWDLPTRIFHWSLAASFAIAWLTAEAEQWQLAHLICGYLFAALIVFRLVWGVIGNRHARFASFVRGPSSTLAYLRGYLSGKPAHYIGHNPLGAIAVVAMLTLGIGIVASGWLTFNEIGGESFEEVHEVFGNAMLLLVFAHILGVVVSSRLHHENLVGAMISGSKTASPGAYADDAGSGKKHGIVALLLVAALGAFGWALAQGKLPTLLDPNHLEQQDGEHDDADALSAGEMREDD